MRNESGGSKVLNGVRKINDSMVSVFLFSLFAIVVLQVFYRYVLNVPLRWTEETARYALIWMVLLAAGPAMRTKSHLQVDIVISAMKPKLKFAFEIFIDLLVVAFLALIVFYGVKQVLITMGQTSPAIQINMAIPYAAIPVGGALALIETVCNLINRIRSGSSAETSDPSIPII